MLWIILGTFVLLLFFNLPLLWYSHHQKNQNSQSDQKYRQIRNDNFQYVKYLPTYFQIGIHCKTYNGSRHSTDIIKLFCLQNIYAITTYLLHEIDAQNFLHIPTRMCTLLIRETSHLNQFLSLVLSIVQVELVGDNLFEWHVRLHQIDPESELAADLRELHIPNILLHLVFPENFPFAPPFMRVIEPRIEKGFVMEGTFWSLMIK